VSLDSRAFLLASTISLAISSRETGRVVMRTRSLMRAKGKALNLVRRGCSITIKEVK